MIAGRRAARVRYEFRLGPRELLALGIASALVVGLIFAAGVLVGRETGGGGPAPRAEAHREAARVEGGGPGPQLTGRPAAAAEEKFTFYRTLTAPTTSDLPPVDKPRVEERMVPGDEPGPAAGGGVTREALEEVATRPAAPTARAPGPARSVKAPLPAAPSRPPPGAPTVGAAAPVPAPRAPDGAWTIQVSAFRSRVLADELRTRLAARGFDAYVLTSASDDGRARYRVRVGAYPTRGDAERVAAELRSERGLNPIVTSRIR